MHGSGGVAKRPGTQRRKLKAQESILQFCVQERMTDVEDNHFKIGVDDWDIIGQCTASLMTVSVVVKQAEGDKYPTSSPISTPKHRGGHGG